jgi:uncharacterized protein (TIGR02145 family)
MSNYNYSVSMIRTILYKGIIIPLGLVLLCSFIISKVNIFENVADYKSVKIGNQIWMVNNLNVSRFRNGEIIPQVKSAEEWAKADKNKQPAWCYYNNNPDLGERFGKIYNGHAVKDARGLAPKGWHIPNKSEWSRLIDFLYGESIAGKKMKSTSDYWLDNGKGSNSSGFTAQPGGMRGSSNPNYDFIFMGYEVAWWSSSGEYFDGHENLIIYRINSRGDNIEKVSSPKLFGYYVRCVKD